MAHPRKTLTWMLGLLVLVVPNGSAAQEDEHVRSWYDPDLEAVHLAWSREPGVVRYEVLRDGAVIASLPAARDGFVDARPVGAALYEVRALATDGAAWVDQFLMLIPSLMASATVLPPWMSDPLEGVDVNEPEVGDCELAYVNVQVPPTKPSVNPECLLPASGTSSTTLSKITRHQ